MARDAESASHSRSSCSEAPVRFSAPEKIFGLTIFPEDYGMLLFVLAPGAFLALGYLIAIVNKIRKTC